jgi:hypothetical protein
MVRTSNYQAINTDIYICEVLCRIVCLYLFGPLNQCIGRVVDVLILVQWENYAYYSLNAFAIAKN